MGIRIKKWNIVYESVSMEVIKPRYLFPSIEEVKKYMSEHPYPESEVYTAEELAGDTQSGGFWSVPDELTTEQEDYIIEMTSHFN